MPQTTEGAARASETNLPDPLVPPEVNLSDYPYMPLDVRRLLRSETWITAADEPRLGHALMCLWAESWHQVPAASLPDNDRVLARFAMCSPEQWAEIRPKALKGWIKCKDGLLYHPVVAEKALEAWGKKRKQRDQTRAATEARARKRLAEQGTASEGSNDARDEERNVERNEERDEKRNVHQERGEERRGDEGKAAANETLAFEGKILRVSHREFESWKRTFDTIPDLLAELTVIDAKFANDPPPKPNEKALAWLRTKHEKNLLEGKQRFGGTQQGAELVSIDPEADRWRMRIKGFLAGKPWQKQWGPPPLAEGCLCPAAILNEFRDQLNARTAAA